HGDRRRRRGPGAFRGDGEAPLAFGAALALRSARALGMSQAHHDSLALELVDGALELPADAREAWIMAQAVAPEVKDRALKLLRLGDGAAEVLPTGGARHRVIEPPDRIGAYRIT